MELWSNGLERSGQLNLSTVDYGALSACELRVLSLYIQHGVRRKCAHNAGPPPYAFKDERNELFE